MSTDQSSDLSMSRTLSIREAAVQAGVTEKTIRRWIKASKLFAVKAGNQYQIEPGELARAVAEQGLDTRVDTVVDITHAGAADNGQPLRPGVDTDTLIVKSTVQDVQSRLPPEEDMSPHVQTPRVDSGQVAVDLSPLAAVIERQGDQIIALGKQLQELTEAATLWQFRARHLEEQVKALTAGGTATDTEFEASRGQGEAQPADRQSAPLETSQGATTRSWWRRVMGRA